MKKTKLEELFDRIVETDVLIIGGGLAGATAANVALDQGVKEVVLVDKAKVARSGQSTFAAGVWALPMPDHDLDVWIEETIRSGEYINDQEWVRLLWEQAYDVAMMVKKWGEDFGYQVFELDEVGGISARKGRGHQKTSHAIMYPIPMMETLKKRAIKKGVNLIERVMINELVVYDGVGTGALGFNYRTGQTYLFQARATIIAAAGCAFRGPYTGVRNITGDLQAAAFRAGGILRNMEVWHSNSGARDHDIHGTGQFVAVGGRWLNNQNEEFMPKYSPELGNRAKNQTKCLAFAREVHEGRGPILFDLTSIKTSDQVFLRRILPHTLLKWDRAGIKPFQERIPWISAFLGTIESGGGIDINVRCETNIPGFYGAGDVTCEPPHGGYAFSGINIAFAAVSGREAAVHAASYAKKAPVIDWGEKRILYQVDVLKTRIMNPLIFSEGHSADQVIYHLLNAIVPYRVSYIKNETTLLKALREVQRIKEEECPQIEAHDFHQLVKANEARNMVEIAEVMLHAALFRKESRSFHFREDYPIMDNLNWLKWILVQKEGNGVNLSTKEIDWIYPNVRPPMELMRPSSLRAI
jgi:fumarate reductase (CoM/CoB) subunit A